MPKRKQLHTDYRSTAELSLDRNGECEYTTFAPLCWHETRSLVWPVISGRQIVVVRGKETGDATARGGGKSPMNVLVVRADDLEDSEFDSGSFLFADCGDTVSPEMLEKLAALSPELDIRACLETLEGCDVSLVYATDGHASRLLTRRSGFSTKLFRQMLRVHYFPEDLNLIADKMEDSLLGDLFERANGRKLLIPTAEMMVTNKAVRIVCYEEGRASQVNAFAITIERDRQSLSGVVLRPNPFYRQEQKEFLKAVGCLVGLVVGILMVGVLVYVVLKGTGVL